jgi:hypothetical protein
MIFEQKKSNVNIVVIQINQVKFELHLVMMINISSGKIHLVFFIILNYLFFSGSEDSWFYIWRTEPSNHGHTASANAKLTRKQRRHFDRAFERIRGRKKIFFLLQLKSFIYLSSS